MGFLWFSMAFLWKFYGISMGFLTKKGKENRISYGISVGYLQECGSDSILLQKKEIEFTNNNIRFANKHVEM